jgi:ankyrin repeat protein
MRACDYGNYDALKMIITNGANLNAQLDSTGMTALLICVLREHYECAQILVESGANVNSVDMYGCTALIMAADNGHTDIMSLLIEHKADVNARIRHQSTALLLTVYHGHVDCVRLLCGVDGIDIAAMDDDGDTALSCAASREHADVVALLIEHKANVNVVAHLCTTAKQGKVGFHRMIFVIANQV